ncbi:MAG: caspase family protein [Candidatus Schekmanbacteria bacterium]|nr:caspase family protein [Candidatus Schekmanbacteria bacterium]
MRIKQVFLLVLCLPSLAYALQVEEPPQTKWESFKGHNNDVQAVAFTPDEKLVASGSQDKTIKIWRVEDGHLLAVIVGHKDWVNALAFSPKGNYLVSAGKDQNINIWQTADWKKQAGFQAHNGLVQALAFSPEGKYLASGGQDNLVKVWREEDWADLATLSGHSGGICSVAFSPGSVYLASGGYDQSVKVWRTDDWSQVITLKGHKDTVSAVAFSGDGKYLATGSHDNTIIIWQLGDWKRVAAIEAHNGDVESLTFSPDAGYLASSGADHFVKIWETKKWTQVTDFQTKGIVWSIAFSPLGKYLAAGNEDGSIGRWNMLAAIPDWHVGLTAFYKARDIVGPQIKVTKPQLNERSEVLTSAYYTFIEGVTQDANKVKWVRINERTADLNVRGEYRLKVDLELGKNYINIIAMDSENNVTRKEIMIEREMSGSDQPKHKLLSKFYRKTWAVIIGLELYKTLPYNQLLKYALNDAKSIEKTLRKKFHFDQYLTLYNREADKESIINALQGELSGAKEGDGVFIFFAGHIHRQTGDWGDVDYLIPYDGSLEAGEMYKNIPISTLREETLKGVKAKHLFLLLDACYDGWPLTPPVENKTGYDLDYAQSMKDTKARLVMTAGKAKEQMAAAIGGDNSLFIDFIIKEMEAARHFISVKDLAGKTLKKVQVQAEKQGVYQTPQFGTLYGNGDFIFVGKEE